MLAIAMAFFILCLFQIIVASAYEADRNEEDTYVNLNPKNDNNQLDCFID